jgi:hypothetical protein
MPGSQRTAELTQTAARTLGHQLVVAATAREEEIEQAFAAIASRGAAGLVVAASPLFNAFLPFRSSILTTAILFRRACGMLNCFMASAMADFSSGASTVPNVESTLPMKSTRERSPM